MWQRPNAHTSSPSQSELIEQLPASFAARSFSSALEPQPHARKRTMALPQSACIARGTVRPFRSLIAPLAFLDLVSHSIVGSRYLRNSQNAPLAVSIEPRTPSSIDPNTSLSGFGS
jgi:hypothetical protein